jgi:hypothetical protein
MAKGMGKLQEGGHHKTVFPSSTRQVKIKNKQTQFSQQW